MIGSYKYLVWGELKLDIEVGSVSKAAAILDDGVWGVNDADVSDGETALIRTAMLADCPSKIEIMKMLIDRGADIEARRHDGSTALSEAVKMANLPAARLLLERGAKVDAPTEKDKPALYYALNPVSFELGMTGLLLGFGASTAELTRTCGDLALNIAAKEHNQWAVIELMIAGEDPRLTSPLDGLSAEQVAQNWDQQVTENLHIWPSMKAMMDARLAEEAISGVMKRAAQP